MPRAKLPSGVTVHQLKVTLQRVRPPIWRRLQIPSDSSPYELHRVLQRAFGWHDAHLHEFEGPRGVRYGPHDPEAFGPVRNEKKVTLEEALPKEKAKLVYQYDFGDSWMHEILVEKILAPDGAVRYPRCVAGKRAGPPEDCGGAWGYMELLEIVADPKHEEHDERKEWLGDDFDPEAFDAEAITAAMQASQARRASRRRSASASARRTASSSSGSPRSRRTTARRDELIRWGIRLPS